MSVVMFAELCDQCGTRSEEYTRFLSCKECMDDVCPECSLCEQDDHEAGKTLCRACQKDMGAA